MAILLVWVIVMMTMTSVRNQDIVQHSNKMDRGFTQDTAMHLIDEIGETQITNPLTAIMNEDTDGEKEAISVATKECVMSPIGLEAEARRFIKRRHLHLQTERRRQRRDGGYSGPVKYKCRNSHTGF